MAKLRAVECREFIKAAIEKADQMGVPVSIAVVGPEGNLIALERMDEAGFVTPETAWAKAYTVAAFRSMSPRFPDGLVIQQWFKERNPQLMIAMAVMTNGRGVRRSGAGLQGQRDGRLLRHQRRDLGPGRGDRAVCAEQGRMGASARRRHNAGRGQAAYQRALRQSRDQGSQAVTVRWPAQGTVCPTGNPH
jgi:uncharacterized protein GlcG (DUF336 family)